MTAKYEAFVAKQKSKERAEQLEADRKSGKATALTMEASMDRIIAAKFGAHTRSSRSDAEHVRASETSADERFMRTARHSRDRHVI